ncbi:hypothetical protein [Microbacterium halophytorum]|nr:hypothetical protein [Microbacterium halophytorum]
MLLLIWGTQPAARDRGFAAHGDPATSRRPDAAELRSLPTQGWQHPPFIG